MSKAFSVVTGIIIAVQLFSFVMEELGLKFWGNTKAEEALSDATEDMNQAFDESTKTLNGMIESFKRFKVLGIDAEFEKTSIAVGNFTTELGSNFGNGINAAIASIRNFKNAQVELRDARKVLDDNTQVSFNNKLATIQIRKTAKYLEAQHKVEEAQKNLEKATLDTNKATELGAAAFVKLRSAARNFEKDVPDFPLLEKLKEAPLIVNTLGDSLKSINDVPELLRVFEKEVTKTGASIESLKSSSALAELFKKIGLTTTGAGKAVTELNANLVLFEGTNTRLAKTVFSSEFLQNYVKIIEEAGKAIGSLKAEGEKGGRGLFKLSESLGVSVKNVRSFVKEFQAAILQAGRLTLDRKAENQSLSTEQSRLNLLRAQQTTFKDSLKILKEREVLHIRELANTLANTKAERNSLALTTKKKSLDIKRLSEVEAEIKSIQKNVQQDVVSKGLFGGEGNQEALNELLKRREIIQKRIAISTEASRDIIGLDARIKLETKELDIAKQGKVVQKAVAEEQASIRQNLRERANLQLQILTAEESFARAAGRTAEANKLADQAQQKRLDRKVLDLALDTQALDSQIRLGQVLGEKAKREKEILALRAKQILATEKQVQLDKLLDSGGRKLQEQGAKGLGKDSTLDFFSTGNNSVFESFMVEGAKRLRDELAKPMVLNIVSDGVFDAAGAGVDALVATIGTGQDETKAVLEAINDTLRTTVVEAVSNGIKTELLKLLAEAKLLSIEQKAGNQAQEAIDQESKAAQTVEQSAMAAFQSSNLGLLAQILFVLSSGNVKEVGSDVLSNIVNAASSSGGSSTVGSQVDAVLSDPELFAKGGVVHKPTFSMIGEGKNSEAVVPLPNNREIPVKLQGSTSGGDIVTNNYDFSGADAATETRLRGLIAENRDGAFNDVFSSINRGGKFAKMSGRR